MKTDLPFVITSNNCQHFNPISVAELTVTTSHNIVSSSSPYFRPLTSFYISCDFSQLKPIVNHSQSLKNNEIKVDDNKYEKPWKKPCLG